MNIDDILRKEEFRSLDEYLTSEMRAYADDMLTRKMIAVFGSEDCARDWFYSNAIALGQKRPYDCCREGNAKMVEDILDRIEHGVYS